MAATRRPLRARRSATVDRFPSTPRRGLHRTRLLSGGGLVLGVAGRGVATVPRAALLGSLGAAGSPGRSARAARRTYLLRDHRLGREVRWNRFHQPRWSIVLGFLGGLVSVWQAAEGNEGTSCFRWGPGRSAPQRGDRARREAAGRRGALAQGPATRTLIGTTEHAHWSAADGTTSCRAALVGQQTSGVRSTAASRVGREFLRPISPFFSFTTHASTSVSLRFSLPPCCFTYSA